MLHIKGISTKNYVEAVMWIQLFALQSVARSVFMLFLKICCYDISKEVGEIF